MDFATCRDHVCNKFSNIDINYRNTPGWLASTPCRCAAGGGSTVRLAAKILPGRQDLHCRCNAMKQPTIYSGRRSDWPAILRLKHEHRYFQLADKGELMNFQANLPA